MKWTKRRDDMMGLDFGQTRTGSSLEAGRTDPGTTLLPLRSARGSCVSVMVQALETQKGTELADCGPPGLTLYQEETENQQINKKNNQTTKRAGEKREQVCVTEQKHHRSRIERDTWGWVTHKWTTGGGAGPGHGRSVQGGKYVAQPAWAEQLYLPDGQILSSHKYKLFPARNQEEEQSILLLKRPQIAWFH